MPAKTKQKEDSQDSPPAEALDSSAGAEDTELVPGAANRSLPCSTSAQDGCQLPIRNADISREGLATHGSVNGSDPVNLLSNDSFVAAALRGLPEADEAVQLARLADSVGGPSLSEIIHFSHQASEACSSHRGQGSELGSAGCKDEFDGYTHPPDEVPQKGKRKKAPPNWRELKEKKTSAKEHARKHGAPWLHS